MSAAYLPQRATIEQSCQWLESTTGEHWTLPRLLEHGMMPWFWLDFQPDWPAVFNGRTEGFFAPLCFAGDLARLEFDCQDAMVTMSRNHDGMLFRLTPGIQFPVTELRFLRADIQRVAESFAMGSSEGSPAAKPADDASPDDPLAAVTPADDYDASLAELFDRVRWQSLAAMFPDEDWGKYAERAYRTELQKAGSRRTRFNPYLAARWWLGEKASDNWTWARCVRVLANNLPDRSKDSKHLLTGELD